MQWILIFLGGGLGSLLRFAVSKSLNPVFTAIPFGTLLSNLLASLILGLFIGLLHETTIREDLFKPFIMVGLCGGFSTFSTFSAEMFQYVTSGQYLTGALYAILSIGICILAIAMGIFIIKIV